MTALALLAALLSEALLASAVAQWIGSGYRDGQQVMPLAALVAVALAGVGAGSALSRFELPRKVRWAVAGLTSYAVLYGSLRFVYAGDLALWNLAWVADVFADADQAAERGADAFIAALLAGTLWARAVHRGVSDVDLESFARSGAPTMAAAALAAALGAATDRAEAVAAAAFASVTAGALALILAQLARSGTTFGDLRAGSFAAALVALALGAAGAAVLLFGIAYAAAAPTLGAALLDGAVFVLTWVLTPVVWVIERLLALLRPDTPELQPPRELARGLLGEGEPGSEPGGGWRALAYLGRASVLMLLLALFAFLGLAAFRFWRRSAGSEPLQAEVERAGGLGDDARELLRRLARRPERGHRRPLHPIAALYLRVVDVASRRGVVRTPGTTPEELRLPLRTAIGDPVTDRITDALESFRYAGRPPDAAGVHRLEEEWRAAERRL